MRGLTWTGFPSLPFFTARRFGGFCVRASAEMRLQYVARHGVSIGTSGRARILRVTFTTGQTPTPATSAPTGAALSTAHADAAGVAAGDRALDVGCGPGVLLAELSRRLGADVPELLDAAPAREGRAMGVGR
jgi:2-polyprenyl-3-methyl-5-hydroxy-6-metoxy-1,4-benzoquinol methylase